MSVTFCPSAPMQRNVSVLSPLSVLRNEHTSPLPSNLSSLSQDTQEITIPHKCIKQIHTYVHIQRRPQERERRINKWKSLAISAAVVQHNKNLLDEFSFIFCPGYIFATY